MIKQILFYSFFISSIFQIPLSQNSNHYISQASNNSVYISSIDGLNIYDGTSVKVYRPDSTNSMYGTNIQSKFFEDTLGNVWFTTYEALNFHNIYSDSIGHKFMTEITGDTLVEDYRAYGIFDNKLLLKAGHQIFIYDMYKQSIVKKIDVDLANSFSEQVFKVDGNYFLTAAYYEQNRTRVLQLSKDFEVIDDKDLDLNTSSNVIYDNHIWSATRSGHLIKSSLEDGHVVDKINLHSNAISGLMIAHNNTFIITTTGGNILFFDPQSLTFLRHELDIASNENGIVLAPPNLDAQNNIWVGVDGMGVDLLSSHESRFQTWTGNKDKFSTTSITQLDDQLYFSSRRDGILVTDMSGLVKQHLIKHPDYEGTYFNNYVGNFDDDIHYTIYDRTYKLSKSSGKLQRCEKCKTVFSFAEGKLGQYGSYRNDNSIYLLGGELNKKIVDNDEFVSSLKIVKDSLLWIGINDAYSKVFRLITTDSAIFIKDIPIVGNVKCITPDRKSFLYTTNFGIHHLDSTLTVTSQIRDDHGHLNGTVYGLLIDDYGNYWCSTNNGIIKYSPITNHSHQFKTKDGLQGLEYNTGSYLKLDDGRMLFGGVNGINIFHPDSITISDYQTTVTISEFELMDKPTREFGLPNYIQEMDLPYDRNYFDFTLVGTDYSSLDDVKLKYLLDGFDNDWQIKPNRHTAEYKKVPPGSYKFRAIASNSDGIWSEHERSIDITIHPPWWQTWWFRMLATFTMLGIVLVGFKYYFNQKLREKDLQLKAQQLTIEKQTALQSERTRIAAEMHDDLGGGLTSIKFLSQKAIRSISDEKEKRQLQKIANHAQSLVTNMSEIIWAMNSRFDDLDNMISYTRHYSYNFFEDYDIVVSFSVEGEAAGKSFSGEQRRHLFLIIKEALTNVLKYAEASQVGIQFLITDNLTVIISDDGIGYDINQKHHGNGLRNMMQRVKKLGGTLATHTKDGVTMHINVPLEIEQNS